jgi:hypothetical protein
MDLKTGDIVIRRKHGISLCVLGAVINDGEMPPHWPESGSLTEARQWAQVYVARTRGTVHEMDDSQNQ